MLFYDATWHDPELVRAVSIFRAELERIRIIARSISARLLVPILPLREAVDASEHPLGREASEVGGQVDLPNRRVAEVLDEFGIAYIDLTPSLAQHAARRKYFVHDGHFTPLGHQLAAQAIVPRILELRDTSSGW